MARPLRAAGLAGASHRRGGPVTTRGDERARPAPDPVERDFGATGPNRLRVADITYVPTPSGFSDPAVVPDARGRKLVGWAMANHPGRSGASPMRAELVLDAAEVAVGQRRPGDVIHHPDRGSRCPSPAFGERRKEDGVRPSVGSVGDACHDATCEGFFATLGCELFARRRFACQAEARMACSSHIQGPHGLLQPQRGLVTTRSVSTPRWATDRPSPTNAHRPRTGVHARDHDTIVITQAPNPSTGTGQSPAMSASRSGRR